MLTRMSPNVFEINEDTFFLNIVGEFDAKFIILAMFKKNV